MSAQLKMFGPDEPMQGYFVSSGTLPNDIVLVPNFVSATEEYELLGAIDQQPWGQDLKRRVQHYGFRYDYKARNLGSEDRIGRLPDWVSEVTKSLVDCEYFDSTPDQMIVNEYRPGQGISGHVDRTTCFGPVVASLSLASDIVMDFNDERGHVGSVLLPRRSMLILSGDARAAWRHGIAQRRRDTINERAFQRERRVSLTFRTVIIAS